MSKPCIALLAAAHVFTGLNQGRLALVVNSLTTL